MEICEYGGVLSNLEFSYLNALAAGFLFLNEYLLYFIHRFRNVFSDFLEMFTAV